MSKACVTKRYNCAVARNEFNKASASVDQIVYATSLLRGPEGPQGIPGPPGSASDRVTLNDVVAGENIAIYKIVYVHNGQAFIASNDDPANAQKVEGFALNAAATGEELSILTFGHLENPIWNWTTPLGELYLGLNGEASETPAPQVLGRFHMVVAETLDTTRINVRLETPIIFT